MPTPKPRPSTNRPPTSPGRSSASRSSTSAAGAPRSTTSRPTSARSTGARPASSRTADLSGGAKSRPKGAKSAAPRPAFNPDDPGVKRRAEKKIQNKRKNLMVWSVFVVASVILTGMSLGVLNGKGRYRDSKARLASKQATLHDLKAELEKAKRRFAAMTSEAGKHRTLVENGFLRDGERMLLFPRDSKKDKP